MTLNAEQNFIINLIRHDFDFLQIEQLDQSIFRLGKITRDC
jgi:hypothetical protein